MTGTEATEKPNGKEAGTKDITKSGSDTKPKDHHPTPADDVQKAPKKRRKVNHGTFSAVFLPTSLDRSSPAC